MKKLFFLSILQVVLVISAIGQSKVYGKPDSFKKPIDYFGSNKVYDNYLLETNPKDKKEPWVVISDRADNQVYKSPNGSSAGTIGFKKSYYVVDEKEDWIKIVEANLNGLDIVSGSRVDIGWVSKKNMLVWNSGIVSPETGIHRKALLLNKAENIDEILRKENKEIVRIFSDPNRNTREPDRKVFEFYFVMKKEGNMMLISEQVNLTPFNMERALVGWVSDSDCDKWDTRICLEPNIEKIAFQERKENPRFRIKAFKNPEGATSYAQGNAANASDVFWANDPVVIDADQLAKSDPQRFKGTVVRFPMVDMQINSSGTEYFTSGLIGSLPVRTKKGGLTSMDEVQYGILEKDFRTAENRSKNLNVFFVIEATESTQTYQAQIANSIEAIDNEIGVSVQEIKYGALLYRGVSEREKDRMTEHIALTTNRDKVINFIEESNFENVVSRSEYTAMYAGLNKALTVAGFDADDLNIVIIIGCNADFKADRISREEATASKDPALLDADKIAANINKLKIHLHALQLKNEGYNSSNFFALQTAYFILENAKFDYNEFQSVKDEKVMKLIRDVSGPISYNSPLMESSEEENQLQGGSLCTGSLIRPSSGMYIEPNKLSSVLKSQVYDAWEFTVNNKKILSKLINEGNAGDLPEIAKDLGIKDVGPYEASFLTYLTNISKNKDLDVYGVLGEKFRLFTKVYIPLNIRGASFPAVSYALFMPESDVKEYKATIKTVSSLTELTSSDQKREKLMDVFKDLVSKFTGGKGADFKKMSSAQLRDLIQGINKQGYKLQESTEYLYKLGDIENKSKVTDSQLNEILIRFKEVEKTLDTALRMGAAYEFCYPSDEQNRYYWIPLRDAF